VSRRAWIVFCLTSLIWGSSFLFIKVAVEDVSPWVVALARTGLGAAVLLPVAVSTNALRGVRGRLAAIVALAALDVAAPFYLTSWGEERISSSLAGILTATDPLFVALLALRFDAEERIGGRRLVGLLIGVVGVVALLGLDVAGDAGAVVGALAVLLSALGYAAAALLYKRRFSDARPLGVVTVALGVSAAAFAVPAAVDLPARMPSPDALAALLTLGVLNTGAGFWLFYTLIAEAGAGRASVITYVMPAVAVVLGILVLSEPLTAGTALGLALTIGGTALSTAREERRGTSRGRRPAVAEAPSARG
jgi:drug/metabolite transporter (DMT)-like permease